MAERYRQLFQCLSDALFVADAKGQILEANPAASKLLGYSAQQLTQKNHSDLLASASRERVQQRVDALSTNDHEQIDAQYLNSANQPINVILDICRLVEDAVKDAPGSLLIVARESSKREELERELRLQRQSAQLGINDGTFVTFYISARNEVGRYPPTQPGEKSRPLDWVPSVLLRPELKPVIERAWAGHETLLPPAWYSPDLLAQTDDDDPLLPVLSRQRWLKISVHPLRLRGSEISDLCVRVHDLTRERLETEEQRWTDQRGFGGLISGSLIHEMNNYLSVIMAQASGLRLSMHPGELPPAGIGAIIDAAQQAAGHLKKAANPLTEFDVRKEIRVGSVVNDCAPLLAHQATGKVEIRLESATDVPPVLGSAELIKTLVVVIGRHFIRLARGGAVVLKTFCAPGAAAGLPSGAGISFCYERDSASGAVPDLSENRMDALDLGIVRAIVRNYRGQLESSAVSAHGGPQWEIILPGLESRPLEALAGKALDATHAHAIPEASPKPIPIQKAAAIKILLADDEENFRMFSSWALRERGYEVIVAKDGQEAFERFQESPENFNLVIMDAYMPRMGGLETYLRMQMLRPDLPVLFASGFVRGPSVDALIEGCPGPAAVILKPFGADDLIKAVEKALTPRE